VPQIEGWLLHFRGDSLGKSAKMGSVKTRYLLLSCLFLGLFISPSHAWEDHFRVTRAVLEAAVPDSLTVPYQPMGAAETKALRLRLKIRKDYVFPTRLHEVPKKNVGVAEILSTYSDEPDWGADQNLFEPDQYPELWNEDSPYVGGKKGLKSQGFRHMYFPGKFSWRDPIVSFQIPMRALGEAPDRAALYRDLSKEFFQNGMPYWGYRFLAWSLHYIEDLFQPFHVCQTPNKAFIELDWPGLLPKIDIAATAEQIGYYHFSYEKWVAEEMQRGKNPLAHALGGGEAGRQWLEPFRDFVRLDVVGFSKARAAEVGKLSYHIFPEFRPQPGETAESYVGTPKWRAKLQQHEEMPLLVDVTRTLFQEMGRVARSVVAAQTESQKKK